MLGKRLKLLKVQERVEALLQEASGRELTYADFLDQLLSEAVVAKTEKHVAMGTALARLPYRKTLESFDLSFQPSLDRKKIAELATGRFTEHGENLIFLGPPGTGKTHLAVALGLKAIQQDIRTLFLSTLGLVTRPTRAYGENHFDERLKFFRQPKLLILDEIGYIPLDRHGAHSLFRRI